MSRMSVSPALLFLALVAAAGTAVGVGVAGAGTSTAVADTGPSTVGAGPADLTAVPNTTNALSIGDPDRQTYARSDVDVVAAAAVSAQRLHAEHDDRVFDSRLADTDVGALELVRDRVDRAAVRLDALDSRYDATLRAYSNGTMGEETFLRRLTRLSAAAESATGHVQHVTTRAEESPAVSVPVSLSTRISDLQTELVTLPDPVKGRVAAGLAGQREPSIVYAGGTAGGLVLAAVEGDEFTRTATLRSALAPDQQDQFEADEGRSAVLALQRGGELYPWAYDNAIGTPQVRGFGNTAVYLIRVDHPQGSIESYLSGGSRDTFHEIQTQRAGLVPVTDTTSTVGSSLNVTVRTTTPTGPMTVTLVQPSTGAALDGTVSVDGTVVGRTGDDGRLYTVQPAGQFRVNASTGANSVAVTVSPAAAG
jgi:hypothetical protein